MITRKQIKKQRTIFGEVLVTCRLHPVRYWLRWIFALIFVFGVATYLFEGKTQDAFILLIPVVLFAGPPLLRIATNKIILTDKAIYMVEGVIRIKESLAPVDKIQNLREYSSLLGRVFGYSSLYVDTISQRYVMKGVRHASDLIEAFYSLDTLSAGSPVKGDG